MLPAKYTKYINIMSEYCDGYNEETGGHNYRLYHQCRVAYAGYKICQTKEFPGANEKIVVIGGLFHDAGRIYILKGNNKNNLKFNRDELDKQKGHEDISKKVLSELLGNETTQKEIDIICEVIHKPENHDDRSIENKILYDADYLDELGSLNLFRMFTYSGINNRSVVDTVSYWFETDREIKFSKLEKCFSSFAKEEGKRRIELQDIIMNELKNAGFPVQE